MRLELFPSVENVAGAAKTGLNFQANVTRALRVLKAYAKALSSLREAFEIRNSQLQSFFPSFKEDIRSHVDLVSGGSIWLETTILDELRFHWFL